MEYPLIRNSRHNLTRQGPPQMDGIALNGSDITQAGLKLLSKLVEKYFRMDNFIDLRGYRSHYLHQIVPKQENLQNKRQGFLALHCEKWPKMAMFMSAGKQEGVMSFPPKNFC